jgi:hypothetical protein
MFYVRSVTASSCLVKTLRLDFAGNFFAREHAHRAACSGSSAVRVRALARRELDRATAHRYALAPLLARPSAAPVGVLRARRAALVGRIGESPAGASCAQIAEQHFL